MSLSPRSLFILATAVLLPASAEAQGAPFISTDPNVVCEALGGTAGPVVFEGDVLVGECEELAGGGWAFHPQGGLGYALIGEEAPGSKDVDPSGAVKSSLSRRWPDGLVPYEIDSSLSDANAPDTYEDIQEAIRHWADGTFIRLIPRTTESAYVRFTAVNSCSSFIGHLGGAQPINLYANGACGFGATVHEIGHAVGIFHEQSRLDRDTYVTINTANIEPGKEHNFNKYTAGDGLDVGPYDYGSIMHYGPTAFSVNGMNTIDVDPVELAAYQAIYGPLNIGTRTGLSFLDRSSVESTMNICYDNSSTVAEEWYTAPWTSCSATCGTLGQTRLVECRNAGTCTGDDALCPSVAKPAESQSCDAFADQDFELGPGAWDALDTSDDFDWTFGIRGTPSTGTGPTDDHTQGAGGDGWYAFIEASSPRSSGDEAYLTSTPFTVPADGDPSVSFWYHADGSSIAAGALELEVTTDPCGSPTSATLWSSDGTSDSAWRQVNLSLNGYLGQTVRLRFIGTVGTSFSSDVALDDIEFHVTPITCGASPDPTCDSSWLAGTVQLNEKIAGKERFLAKLQKGPALTQPDLGAPLDPSGTAYVVCVFDDAGLLVGEMLVDRAGEACGTKDCWKALGGAPPGGKGYLYKDKTGAEDGITLVKMKGGNAGKSLILVKGANNAAKGQTDLPTGLAAALSGSTEATVEIHGDDLAQCYSATFDDVKKDFGFFYQAKPQ